MKNFYKPVKRLVFIAFLFAAKAGFAQNVGINSTGNAPDASAGLDVSFTDKGLLIPRIALTATNSSSPITSPTTSLLVYNTATAGAAPNNVTPGYYYWNGLAWTRLATGTTSQWTTSGSNISYSTGNVGVGVSSPTYKLQVGAASNPLFLSGVQLGAASDSILTIASGIVKKLPFSSVGSNWTTSGTNAYFSNTGNVGIGVSSPTYKLQIGATSNPLFMSGVQTGTTTDSILTIAGGVVKKLPYATGGSKWVASGTNSYFYNTGNVGIGVTSPTYKLQIGAASNPLFLSGVQAGATTDSILTIASGIVKKLPYSTAGNQWTVSGANVNYGTGNVGIGVPSPTYKLQVGATSNPLFLSGVQVGNTSSDSILTISSGVVRKIAIVPTPSTNAWSLTGTPGLTSYFLGTTNNTSLRMRTNNVQRLYLDSLGSVGVGTSPSFTAAAREKFLVDAGGSQVSPLAATNYNLINGKGYINNYLQLNVQNRYAGTAASSDVVATADNGDESTNFVDMGINSSANSSGAWGGANDSYLYNMGQDFLIGTGTANKSLKFLTGGSSEANNTRMTIDGNGNVGLGISNITPLARLHLAGNTTYNPLYVSGLPGGTIADSLLAISNGVVKKLAPNSYNSFIWTTNGNSLTSGDFLGSTNSSPLYFKTNNTQRMMFDVNGNAGIGTSPTFSAAAEKLLVDAGTTTSYNAIVARGTINNYFQLNIQNKSNGTTASSDIVATNDTGSESTNFVDLGINSSTNASGAWGGASDSYLYNMGEDFLIGTGTASKSLKFLTGGSSETTNTRMVIDGSGNVGIGTGTATLTSKFNIKGLPTGASTDSLLTISNGVVRRISPSASGNWTQGGNTLTAEQDFGTKNGYDLPFIVNNTERMRINTSGRIGIGTAVMDSTFINVNAGLVAANNTGFPTLLNLEGSRNGYLQFNVQNNNSGNRASTDIVATANNGTEQSAYIDMGINSGSYSSGNNALLNGANTAYLYANAGQMFIGNAASNQPLIFFTNSGSASDEDASGAERMRILATGEVGIGTTTITSGVKLQVNGNIKATNVIYNSDQRLKTNIAPLRYGLKEINALLPVSYNWKDAEQGKTLQLGLIAQDAKKVIPEIVAGDESKEMLGINYTELVPVLINAIKEQQKQIEDLKKKVESLENK